MRRDWLSLQAAGERDSTAAERTSDEREGIVSADRAVKERKQSTTEADRSGL